MAAGSGVRLHLPLDDGDRSVWLIGFVIIYAWVRGRLRDTPSLDSAYTMLRVGTVIVAITSVLTLTSQDPASPSQQYVRPLVLGFFFCALSAITVARLQVEGLRAQGRLGPQWLGPLLLPVVLVLIIGMFVAAMLSRQFLETVTTFLTPVLVVLEFILRVIITIISLIAYLLYLALSALIGALAGGTRTHCPLTAPPRDFAQQADHAVASFRTACVRAPRRGARARGRASQPLSFPQTAPGAAW